MWCTALNRIRFLSAAAYLMPHGGMTSSTSSGLLPALTQPMLINIGRYPLNPFHPASDQHLRQHLLDDLAPFAESDDETYQTELRHAIARRLYKTGVSGQDRTALFEAVYNQTRGLDILQPLMNDPGVTEIMVNGPDAIFYEKAGELHRSNLRFDQPADLENLIYNLFSRVNRNLNLSQPIADARLPDGSRANAVLPPAAPDGPILTLRKFTGIRHTPEALVQSGFINTAALHFLKEKVESRSSVFICGGTGTGKTTLLNVLSNYIPKSERVVTIEDSAELQLIGQENLVRLEVRQPGPDGQGGIDLRQLIRASLRMRPDRLIIGEVRGAEAADFVQAMNTGHPGALCTGHGNSCQDMFMRLGNLVLEGSRLPPNAIRAVMAACINIMVHISRYPGGLRRVDEICSVDASAAQCKLTTLYRLDTKTEQLLETHHETTLPFA